MLPHPRTRKCGKEDEHGARTVTVFEVARLAGKPLGLWVAVFVVAFRAAAVLVQLGQ